MRERRDIQILRGIAIVLVLLFHWQTPFLTNGFLGVDVFFVISGYWMAKLYGKGTRWDFYRARIDRLLPAYAVTVLGVLIASAWRVIPVESRQLSEQAMASAIFIPNAHFWGQNSYFDKAAFNPLLNLWSLGVEAQFYLLVPLVYPLLERRRVLTLIMAGLSFILCIGMQAISPKTAFFLMPFRGWEFFIGAWIAWNGADVRAAGGRLDVLQWVLLFLLVGSVMSVPIRTEDRSLLYGHPSLSAAWICLLTAAIIQFGMPRVLEKAWLGRALATVGDYSYSIYLVHFPLIVLWNYSAFGGTVLGVNGAVNFAGVAVATAMLSYCLYHWVEKEKTGLLKTGGMRATMVVSMLCAAPMVTFVTDFQWSPREHNIFAAWTDRSEYRCGKLFRIANPLADVCPITDGNAHRKVLLLGNSHADSIKSSFVRVAERNGVGVYFSTYNEPLVDPSVDAGKVLEGARRLGIDAIVIHFNNVYTYVPYVDAIDHLINSALSVGMSVSIIAPIPVYEVHIPRAIYEAESLGVMKKFGVSRRVHNEMTREFQVFVEKYRDRHLIVVDPADVLCPKDSDCLHSDSMKKPYYFDSNHLTRTGAALLEPLLDRLLKDVVAAR
ncbi:MAG TPA: acyltransferase family protein [Nitrospira sp.]|nr:acyltransferase family protein [Nitrospira sp.]